MQRRGQTQSWTPGALQTKKRKGSLSQQPQEQQIKSPQSTWCTLHLWKTCIDNESSQNWGGGLWEQRYICIFPFSLFDSTSCPIIWWEVFDIYNIFHIDNFKALFLLSDIFSSSDIQSHPFFETLFNFFFFFDMGSLPFTQISSFPCEVSLCTADSNQNFHLLPLKWEH